MSELSERMEVPPTLYVDSLSAVKLAKNPEYHCRSKHIELKHRFVREKHLSNGLCTEHIDGTNQIAATSTKALALDRARFEKMRLELGVVKS